MSEEYKKNNGDVESDHSTAKPVPEAVRLTILSLRAGSIYPWVSTLILWRDIHVKSRRIITKLITKQLETPEVLRFI